jgi:hypothetical protein
MDWSTLAPTALGGALALGGGFLGQWWGERRTVEREQRAWEREDRGRSYDQRRDAYSDFLASFNAFYDKAAFAKMMDSHQEPPEDWLSPLYFKYVTLRVFGAKSIAETANQMFMELNMYATISEAKETKLERLIDDYLNKVRNDLKVPD